MNDFNRAKQAALLYVLNGNNSDLEVVLNFPKRYALIRWMDNAGVALELFQRSNSERSANPLPDWSHRAFNARLQENRIRVATMFDEVRTVVDVLSARNIQYAVVKGFSLEPDFCPDINLRHFVDLDLLIHPNQLTEAIGSLQTLGYQLEGAEEFGEVRLLKQTARPEPGDSIYALRSGDKLEIHSQQWENRARSSFQFPERWQTTLQQKERNGFSFATISAADAIIYHVLHAFQHMTTGWLRAVWLLEIVRFMRSHRSDDKVWQQVTETLELDPRGRDAFALVIAQINELFGAESTDPLRNELLECLPEVLLRWVRTYGKQLCLADFETPSRHFELIQAGFVSSPRSRSVIRRTIWSSRANLLLENWASPSFLIRGISRQASACVQWARWHAGGALTRARKFR